MAAHKKVQDESPYELRLGDIVAEGAALRLVGEGPRAIPVPPDERLIQFLSRLSGPLALGLGVLALGWLAHG